MLKVFLATIFLALVALMGLRFTDNQTRPKSGHFAAVHDTSGSAADLGCPALIATVSTQLRDPAFAIGKDSHFILITTGGVRSGFQPRMVIDEVIPRRSGGILGVDEAEFSNFLDRVSKACAGLPVAEGSAIVRGVEIALQELRIRGCGPHRICRLALLSDGIESQGNPEVEAYLRSRAKAPKPPLQLDNAAVTSRSLWCGYAQGSTAGAMNPLAQQMVDRFNNLFTRPLELHPNCNSEQQTTATVN